MIIAFCLVLLGMLGILLDWRNSDKPLRIVALIGFVYAVLMTIFHANLASTWTLYPGDRWISWNLNPLWRSLSVYVGGIVTIAMVVCGVIEFRQLPKSKRVWSIASTLVVYGSAIGILVNAWLLPIHIQSRL
ncbi:MAG: hypothetical protein AAF585_05840 [Verrucomicrobiota bacterium]